MRRSRALGALAAVALSAGLGGRAQAALVEFSFSGTITTVQGDPFGPWADLEVGDPWAWRFVFDDTEPDSDPSPLNGFYWADFAEATINGVSLTIDDAYVTVDLLEGAIDFVSENGPMNANGGTFFLPASPADDSLPVDYDFNIPPIAGGDFGVASGPDEWFFMNGDVNHWSVTTIPAPATWLIFIMLGRRRRARGKRTEHATMPGRPACPRDATHTHTRVMD